MVFVRDPGGLRCWPVDVGGLGGGFVTVASGLAVIQRSYGVPAYDIRSAPSTACKWVSQRGKVCNPAGARHVFSMPTAAG
ncbi:hypothetical protein LMG28140_00320 [Paraburkholderia metrosideri]|uniref:Uncharacterized protein n=1 Tax=Paraburkholderia metrosideri TaxID=580937 RepID=A0ABN7HDJ8_9BURK|nr:hypothetical protein LMG28140_00320 [Paraburkholderia metrosideri]